MEAAVVHETDLGVVVDTREGLEDSFLALVRLSLDLDGLAGLQPLEAADREALLAGQAERLQVLAVGELEGEDAHAYQVRPVDSLQALRNHGANTEEQRAFGRPVARRSGSVLLARDHDERHALGAVLLRRLEDRGCLAVGQVHTPIAFALDQLVAQPDVAERAAHLSLVVATPGAEAVEVPALHAVLDEVLAGRAVGRDRARG